MHRINCHESGFLLLAQKLRNRVILDESIRSQIPHKYNRSSVPCGNLFINAAPQQLLIEDYHSRAAVSRDARQGQIRREPDCFENRLS